MIPEPEVPARPARPEEIPSGAKTVINRLKKHGWFTEVFYARGPWINPHSLEPDTMTMWQVGEPGSAEQIELVAVTASLLVRATRDRQQLAAMWVLRPGLKGASFKLQFAYAKPTPPGQCVGRIDSKQLKTITESEVTP